ncbi:hypothetical protein YC2023_048439 [Brassica napus]
MGSRRGGRRRSLRPCRGSEPGGKVCTLKGRVVISTSRKNLKKISGLQEKDAKPGKKPLDKPRLLQRSICYGPFLVSKRGASIRFQEVVGMGSVEDSVGEAGVSAFMDQCW